MTTFSDRLKELRNNKGVTQKTVAEHICILEQAYQKYEYGKHEPNQENLIKIADYFDVSIDYLLGRTDAKEVNTHNHGRALFDNLVISSEIYPGIMLTQNEDNRTIIAECIDRSTREYLRKEFPVIFVDSFFLKYFMELWDNGERTHVDDFDATVKSIYKGK